MLEDRGRRDWEARKKRVFEQLGARVGGENRAVAELKKSTHGKSLISVSSHFIQVSHYAMSLSIGCSDQCRTKPQSAYAEQDDGIRPCCLRVKHCQTARHVLPDCSRIDSSFHVRQFRREDYQPIPLATISDGAM